MSSLYHSLASRLIGPQNESLENRIHRLAQDHIPKPYRKHSWLIAHLFGSEFGSSSSSRCHLHPSDWNFLAQLFLTLIGPSLHMVILIENAMELSSDEWHWMDQVVKASHERRVFFIPVISVSSQQDTPQIARLPTLTLPLLDSSSAALLSASSKSTKNTTSTPEISPFIDRATLQALVEATEGDPLAMHRAVQWYRADPSASLGHTIRLCHDTAGHIRNLHKSLPTASTQLMQLLAGTFGARFSWKEICTSAILEATCISDPVPDEETWTTLLGTAPHRLWEHVFRIQELGLIDVMQRHPYVEWEFRDWNVYQYYSNEYRNEQNTIDVADDPEDKESNNQVIEDSSGQEARQWQKEALEALDHLDLADMSIKQQVTPLSKTGSPDISGSFLQK